MSIESMHVYTHRKLVCDCKLVNNTNLHSISHHFPVIVYSISQIAFDKLTVVLVNFCDYPMMVYRTAKN